MMRKRMFLLLLVPLLLATRASAITYGEPDGGGHPNVGALVAQLETGERQLWCSGTLISPTVFLTAAHCIDAGVSYFVTFDQEVSSRAKLHPGTPHVHPAYTWMQDDPNDMAVIVLDRPVRGIPPAALPSAGLFDRMAADHTLNGQKFTAVGYGILATVGGGAPSYEDTNLRWRSVSEFNALNSVWLRLSQNDSTGDGGTCYGDSGGPNFLGSGANETSIIAAITVTGDVSCAATNVTYRLDTPSARSFLGRFVTLP